MAIADQMAQAARDLADGMEKLRFAPPVSYVYNPLIYAWKAHELYLRRYGNSTREVIFLGMNPGPFGMMQTGVPFGEIAAVRDWMKIEAKVDRPAREHPKRLIQGFDCARSEVSGRRLWGLFAQRFGSPEKFFARHFVANYCPLAFLEETGRNHTPDKLAPSEREAIARLCDAHLPRVVEIMRPQWIVGVGDFAAKRTLALADMPVKLGRILHPSPASPAANQDWAGKAEGRKVFSCQTKRVAPDCRNSSVFLSYT
jgi:single-strand selective monofunctional uracil DNA glycosylase